jgi:hypothetical protein
MTSRNFCLSGPSVIEPSAIKDAYLFFQLSSYMLAATN